VDLKARKMGVIKKIQNDCRRATSLVEKRQLTRLNLKERIVLAIHLAGCSFCRIFQQQSRMINKLMRSFHQSETDPLHHLDEESKRQMQEQINDRMKN
jgi:hypothetical protein